MSFGTAPRLSAPVEETMRASSDGDARKRRHLRSGGDQNLPGLQSRLFAFGRCDGDDAGVGDRAHALDIVHLVLAQQELDALGEVAHHLVLAPHHSRQVDRHFARLDAVLGEHMGCLVVELGRMQERLGRDAADVKARAAERAARFDAGRAHAQLRSTDGRHITAGTAADHDEVVLAFAHSLLPPVGALHV